MEIKKVTLNGENIYRLSDLPISKQTRSNIINKIKNELDLFYTENFFKLTKKEFDFIVGGSGEIFTTKKGLLLITERCKMPLKYKTRIYDMFDEKVINPIKEIEFMEKLKHFLGEFGWTIETQLYCCGYRLDGYIRQLNVAIEYDENDHKEYDKEKEEYREKLIKGVTGCEFIRISDSKNDEQNLAIVMQKLLKLGVLSK